MKPAQLLYFAALAGTLGWARDAQLPGIAAVGALLAVLWLDKSAARLPWGWWRASGALILACPGALAATLMVATGFLTVGSATWTEAAGLQLLVLARSHLPYPWSGALLGLLWLAWRRVPLQSLRELAERRLAFALWPMDVALAASVPLLALLPELYLALAGALLWALQEGVGNVEFRVFAGRAAQALDRLETSQRDLQKTSQRLEQRDQDLQRLRQQQALLEGFARHLARGPSLVETLQGILETVRNLMPCRTVVVFQMQNQLVPAAILSPEKEAIEGSVLTGLRHPLVEQAFEWERACCWQGQQGPQKMLASELFAVAAPLGKLGVLYVGRVAGAISVEESQMVTWLASKASLALDAAARQQSSQVQLAEQTTQNYALRERLQLLEKLVEGSLGLAAQLSVESLLDALQRELESTLRHDGGILFMTDGEALPVQRYWPANRMDSFDIPSQVATLVAQNRTPLLFPDLQQTRFAGDPKAARSLIAAPLAMQEKVMGVLLLQAQPPNSFDREHLQVLTLVALQLAVFLSNAQLYQQVVEGRKKLELSQAQLIQSSKLTAIGQLAAGVAHELNTPLGAISLSLEMLELAGAAGKPLANAQAALERAQKIVQKLLVYARKETDTQTYWVNVREVVDSAVELVAARTRLRRVMLVKEEFAPWEVQARTGELQQVLVNLLINAADAYEDQKDDRKIVLRARALEQGGCTLEVQDFAAGIPEAVQERIFEPFFTTKPVGEGTGLGLSISREIVEMFGAELAFASRAGEGTTFSVLFPPGLARLAGEGGGGSPPNSP